MRSNGADRRGWSKVLFVFSDWSSLGLLGLVAVLILAPYLARPDRLIWPTSGFYPDTMHMYWVDQLMLREAIANDEPLLWSDLTGAGRPIRGDLNATGVYPPTLLYVLFPPALAYTVVGLVHVFLSGVLTYFLIRELFGVSRFAATVGALTMMLAPKLFAHLAIGHHLYVFGFAWIPAILWGAWAAFRRRCLWPALLGGLALALQLMTHPQFPIGTAFLMMGMFGWACLRTLGCFGWRSAKFWDAVGRTVVIGALIGGVGVIVSAAWWLPIVELLPWLVRVEFGGETPFYYQMPPAMLLSLLAPLRFQFHEWVVYAGVVPLFLSLIALIGPCRREAWFLWAGVVLALLFSLGDATPVYVLLRWVPGLSYFRTQTRIWAFGGVALALLAGLGADALVSVETQVRLRRYGRLLNLLGAGYVLAGVLVVAGFVWIERRFPVEIANAFGVGMLALLAFWLRQWLRVHRLLWQPILLVLLLGDLLPASARQMTGIDPWQTVLKPDAAAHFLREQGGEFRVYSPHHNLAYGLAAEWGIESMHGIYNMQLSHLTELAKVASGCRLEGYAGGMPPCLSGEIDVEAYRTAVPEPSLLGLLNVRYVLADFPLNVSGLEPILREGEVTVYENQRFLPRAFLAQEVRPFPDSENPFDVLLTVDVVRTVLVDPSEVPSWLDTGLEGQVSIVSRRPGHVELEVKSSREALLVYSETWAPGWRATIQDRRVTVIRADGALLGVVVPSGRSYLTLDYCPWGWQIGWPVSILASLVVLVASGFNYIRWRQRQTCRLS